MKDNELESDSFTCIMLVGYSAKENICNYHWAGWACLSFYWLTYQNNKKLFKYLPVKQLFNNVVYAMKQALKTLAKSEYLGAAHSTF